MFSAAVHCCFLCVPAVTCHLSVSLSVHRLISSGHLSLLSSSRAEAIGRDDGKPMQRALGVLLSALCHSLRTGLRFPMPAKNSAPCGLSANGLALSQNQVSTTAHPGQGQPHANGQHVHVASQILGYPQVFAFLHSLRSVTKKAQLLRVWLQVKGAAITAAGPQSWNCVHTSALLLGKGSVTCIRLTKARDWRRISFLPRLGHSVVKDNVPGSRLGLQMLTCT